MSERVGLAVELAPDKLAQYIEQHRAVWPEVEQRFREVGFREVTLFLHGTTVFMTLVYDGEQPFEDALREYAADPKIQAWEELNAECKRIDSDAAENGFSRLPCLYQFVT